MSDLTWNANKQTRTAELVRRLRSGEYVQGNGHLKKDDTYCCLGVACEMAVEAGVTQRFTTYRPGVAGYGPNGSATSIAALPPAVREWLGFSSGYGTTVIGRPDQDEFDSPYELAGLNDNGMPFDQIADVIENGLVKTDDGA